MNKVTTRALSDIISVARASSASNFAENLGFSQENTKFVLGLMFPDYTSNICPWVYVMALANGTLVGLTDLDETIQQELAELAIELQGFEEMEDVDLWLDAKQEQEEALARVTAFAVRNRGNEGADTVRTILFNSYKLASRDVRDLETPAVFAYEQILEEIAGMEELAAAAGLSN